LTSRNRNTAAGTTVSSGKFSRATASATPHLTGQSAKSAREEFFSAWTR
jgi:hypothetical protein